MAANRRSLNTPREHERWERNKRGEWRYVIDTVDGYIFNNRVMRQHPGFARHAKIRQGW